jgi:predicted enzyme related to lactoylglutathione lyase
MAKKAEALGGKVVEQPTDLPIGRYAVIADPSGAPFALWKAYPHE